MAGDTYCRFLQSLKAIASERSTFIADALSEPTVPMEEVAEHIADQWKQLVLSGYPFELTGGMAIKNLELASANSLIKGSESEKEAAFKSTFMGLLKVAPLVTKCVMEEDGGAAMASHLGNFEQLAGEVIPGMKWRSAHCVKAVEHELHKMKLGTLIDSWGTSPIQIISNLRAHLKNERASSAGNKLLSGDNDKVDDRGMLSASGVAASRTPNFLKPKVNWGGARIFLRRWMYC